MKSFSTSRPGRTLLERGLIALHRWLGIGLALLLFLWSASAVVMIYVAFPELTPEEHFSGLDQLDLERCCAANIGELLEGWPAATVEMLDGRPVAKVGDTAYTRQILDLRSGRWNHGVTSELASAVAERHIAARGKPSKIADITTIESDQWTVYGSFTPHRPLYRVQFDSAAGDVLYVSSRVAEVVQDTTAHERFWNWFGAVPHWLYFRAIRERQVLWYNLVVYTSLLGTILTATGLFLGVTRTLASPRRWTPYLGPMRWHHVTGLIFGTITLTWVFSGLLSMNPWGWLDGSVAHEQEKVQLPVLDSHIVDNLVAGVRYTLDPDVVSLLLSPGPGDGQTIVTNSHGKSQRLMGAPLRPTPPSGVEILGRLSRLHPDVTVESIELLEEEDEYYFTHKGETKLPVFRAVLDNAERTRYYIDADTGAVIGRLDRSQRWYRWLHYGLHRLDFSALMRSRPLWDILILVLLIGVTFLCALGCWVGYRHLRYGR